jgi:hypothetical protein
MPDIMCQPLASIGVAHVEPHVDQMSVVRTTIRAWVCAWRRNNRHIFDCDRFEDGASTFEHKSGSAELSLPHGFAFKLCFRRRVAASAACPVRSLSAR